MIWIIFTENAENTENALCCTGQSLQCVMVSKLTCKGTDEREARTLLINPSSKIQLWVLLMSY